MSSRPLNSTNSRSLPPTSPNHSSPIHAQPCNLAASGSPPLKGSHQILIPTMDNAGHNHGANLSHGAHMGGAMPMPYHPLARYHDPCNNLLPQGGYNWRHFVHDQRKRPVRAVQVCSLCSSSASTISSSAILILHV